MNYNTKAILYLNFFLETEPADDRAHDIRLRFLYDIDKSVILISGKISLSSRGLLLNQLSLYSVILYVHCD